MSDITRFIGSNVGWLDPLQDDCPTGVRKVDGHGSEDRGSSAQSRDSPRFATLVKMRGQYPHVRRVAGGSSGGSGPELATQTLNARRVGARGAKCSLQTTGAPTAGTDRPISAETAATTGAARLGANRARRTSDQSPQRLVATTAAKGARGADRKGFEHRLPAFSDL